MNDFQNSVVVGLKAFPPFLYIDWGSRVGVTVHTAGRNEEHADED